ncbi:APC family permease [Nocardioides pocheonensis]|jgi:amino acid transporter|uniref:APC family permease n=1 Tax=Nocardioides pocheonensis TaxID=661485 RepID=A0A3N0GI77_9ACTN|nr:APC family permease [Nocardioides pocheonensis]RNM11818.1 APC family permease [Nocardioides pocheonensis]
MSPDFRAADSTLPPPTGLAQGQDNDVQAAKGDTHTLEGHMGTFELMMTVLAFTAPIVVVVAFIPFVLVFGGIGAPAIFGIAAVLLLFFAVGYTTMSRFLPNPGAFYAYITAGLGRPLGLASSFIAVFGYVMMAVGTYLLLGVVASSLVDTTFHGPTITWYWLSLVGVALTGVLGYFRIDLSAKVLTVAMLCEVAIVAIFDLAVFRDGGPQGRSLEPFTLHAVTSGSLGLGLLFAAGSFLGFEATAIFRDEVKNPLKTIPRATYLCVVLIGVLYVVTSWLTTVAFGHSKTLEVAFKDPSGMVPHAAEQYVGVWARDVVTILVVSSAFAAVLSVQNILARYIFSLGTDRVLPRALGKVHPTHGSPYLSSLLITTVSAIGVLLSVGADPIALYAKIAGIGGFGLMLLIFLTGVSVVAFFRRHPQHAAHATVWHTVVAPLLGSAGMGAVLYLSITHFKLVTGGSMEEAIILQVALWVIFVAGLVAAAVFRSTRPDTYARIGRQKVG